MTAVMTLGSALVSATKAKGMRQRTEEAPHNMAVSIAQYVYHTIYAAVGAMMTLSSMASMCTVCCARTGYAMTANSIGHVPLMMLDTIGVTAMVITVV